MSYIKFVNLVLNKFILTIKAYIFKINIFIIILNNSKFILK